MSDEIVDKNSQKGQDSTDQTEINTKSEENIENKFFERQLIVFKIGKEEFGIDISDVKEIIKPQDILKIPGCDDHIKGIINLRNNIIVMVDLGKKLCGNDTEINDKTRAVITEIDGKSIGFIVDSCNEVLNITGDKIQSSPDLLSTKVDLSYIYGVGIIEKRLIIIIDLAKIISNDQSRIQSMTNLAQHLNPSQPSNPNQNPPQSTDQTQNTNLTQQTPSSITKKKVLIVDDSTMMRGTLKSYIDISKYDILEAGNGMQAFGLAKQEKPDLILMDIKMPKMNGIETLEKIKQATPGVIVIMETSVYDEAVKEQCLKLGAKEYLKKPISKAQIEQVLKYI